MSSPANPTGIVLTQQQIDESFKASYWDDAVRSGTFYYIAGRYAVMAGFMVVHANILHHGVEMLMKAFLAKGVGGGINGPTCAAPGPAGTDGCNPAAFAELSCFRGIRLIEGQDNRVEVHADIELQSRVPHEVLVD